MSPDERLPTDTIACVPTSPTGHAMVKLDNEIRAHPNAQWNIFPRQVMLVHVQIAQISPLGLVWGSHKAPNRDLGCFLGVALRKVCKKICCTTMSMVVRHARSTQWCSRGTWQLYNCHAHGSYSSSARCRALCDTLFDRLRAVPGSVEDLHSSENTSTLADVDLVRESEISRALSVVNCHAPAEGGVLVGTLVYPPGLCGLSMRAV